MQPTPLPKQAAGDSTAHGQHRHGLVTYMMRARRSCRDSSTVRLRSGPPPRLWRRRVQRRHEYHVANQSRSLKSDTGFPLRSTVATFHSWRSHLGKFILRAPIIHHKRRRADEQPDACGIIRPTSPTRRGGAETLTKLKVPRGCSRHALYDWPRPPPPQPPSGGSRPALALVPV